MQHEHTWATRYETIDDVDCASGMECECGMRIDQFTVEDAVNHAQSTMQFRLISKDGHYEPELDT